MTRVLSAQHTAPSTCRQLAMDFGRGEVPPCRRFARLRRSDDRFEGWLQTVTTIGFAGVSAVNRQQRFSTGPVGERAPLWHTPDPLVAEPPDLPHRENPSCHYPEYPPLHRFYAH